MITDMPLHDYQSLPAKQIYIDYKGIRIAAKDNTIHPTFILAISENFLEEN